MEDDILLEPLRAYDERYRDEFAANAKAYVQELIEKSGVDVAQNRSTVRKYETERATSEKYARQLRAQKAWRVFCVFLAVLGGIAAVIGIYLLTTGSALAGGLSLGIGAALLGGGIALAAAVLTPRIRQNETLHAEHARKAEEHLAEAWRQTAPLNALFETNATKRLIEKTVPLLKIDDTFEMRRYDYLQGKYGFGDNDDETRSTIALVTGEILGNPFVFDRELVQQMRMHTYFGSLVIHWTTTYTDSDGHRHTEHHSQTLTAEVTKPKPAYEEQTRLIYGNDAAPDLSFTHTPSHAERMDERAREGKVKSGKKKIKKMQEKALKRGASNFTEMGNAEFDVLFGALDRDHEVQFRLLFTPLAQKNMLSLMTSGVGFGDDFTFRKRKCLNYVSGEHSAYWDLDTSYTRYASYSVDIAQTNFSEFNTAYFKHMFFEFAPLLSIPLYQQHKPKEYIYREVYERNYTAYETEYVVNRLGDEAFTHPDARTPSILKTAFRRKDGATDEVCVTAHAFRTEEHVDYIPRLGGDGMMHSVPVPWTEYIPVSRESTVKLKQLSMTDKEYVQKTHAPAAAELFGAVPHVFAHGLMCCLVRDDPFDTGEPFDEKVSRMLK